MMQTISKRFVQSFSSVAEHEAWLKTMSALPKGFRVGTTDLTFKPVELPEKTAKMKLTMIALDEPSPSFHAMFTTNAFPGAPILVGRSRLTEPTLQAILVNNKISNVCAPGGVETSEAICNAVAKTMGLESGKSVLPSSTGIIGQVAGKRGSAY